MKKWVLYCVSVCMCGFCKVSVCVCVYVRVCMVWNYDCVGFPFFERVYVWVL